jgi:hypothetical protein
MKELLQWTTVLVAGIGLFMSGLIAVSRERKQKTSYLMSKSFEKTEPLARVSQTTSR